MIWSEVDIVKERWLQAGNTQTTLFVFGVETFKFKKLRLQLGLE